ncbi:MAG: hypothetical protein ACR2JP_10070 [Acidimicrobiia bacterium]
MTHPAATRLAGGLFGLFVLLLGLTGVMSAIAPPPPPGVEPLTADAALFSVGLLGIMAAGTLVAGRHPANPIGWLLCGFGLVQVVAPLTYLYAIVGFAGRGQPLPGAAIAAWVTVWIWIPPIALLGLALLLFPDGRPPSARWRPVVWVAIAGIGASLALGAALWPQRGLGLLTIDDDFPVVASVPGNISLTLTFASFVAGAVSLIFRFLSSRGEERLQLKWLMFATGVAASGLIGLAVADAAREGDPLWVDLVSTVGILGIPAAIGIAIFKYRLYAIDRIISRTVSYALLTGLLLTVYVGGVLVLGPVLRPVTGSNDLSVAGSTLAVAALFSPARRRIQSFVDRRFNRRRYDAARTVEAFSARLREEVDLNALRSDLTSTVRETLQPAHVSLWLRE